MPVPISVAGRGSATVTIGSMDRLEVDGAGQADRLLEARLRRARQARPRSRSSSLRRSRVSTGTMTTRTPADPGAA